jgi:membrane protease YdiL (CAAX protease family)
MSANHRAGETTTTRATWLAVAELAAVLVIFLGANVWDFVPIAETPWILVLAWVSLRFRRRSWNSLGWKRPASWPRAFAVAVVTAVGLQLLSIFVTEPLLTRLTGEPLHLSRFAPLVGNVKLLLVWFAVAWTLAAFGEELAYRGYVLNRAADLGGGTTRAWWGSMVAVSLLFGLGHLYQGVTGAADSTITGLVLGSLYLLSGRTLRIPIMAHGFTDTIAIFLVFFDQVPAVYR